MGKRDSRSLGPISLWVGVGFVVFAQFAAWGQQAAPSWFDNQTNGFEEQNQFNEDRIKKFEEVEEVKQGLGPVYNATACVACHQNPVSGSSSQVSEIRAGHRELRKVFAIPPAFDFVEPPGGSLIHQRAIDAEIQEIVPPEDEVRTLRMSTNILGNGFVEVLQDQQLLDACQAQHKNHPGMEGTPILVPVAVSVKTVQDGKPTDFNFVLRLGRFGWKDQEASLLNFSANAYLNEIGITSPLQPQENKSNGRDVSKFDPVADPEDPAVPSVQVPTKPSEFKHPFGEDVEAFTRFMRSTKVPPRSSAAEAGPAAPITEKGKAVFTKVECAVCHIPEFTTPDAGTAIQLLHVPGNPQTPTQGSDLTGGTVPAALGKKTINPYSDFLLHDVGTGDGIVQTQHAQLPPRGAERLLPTLDRPAEQRGTGSPCDLEQLKAVQVLRQEKVEISLQNAPPVQQEARVLDQRTANMIRTAPLWGVRVRPQLLHDGSALTIEEAILRHSGQAEDSKRAFEALSREEKDQLLLFLNSL